MSGTPVPSFAMFMKGDLSSRSDEVSRDGQGWLVGVVQSGTVEAAPAGKAAAASRLGENGAVGRRQ